MSILSSGSLNAIIPFAISFHLYGYIICPILFVRLRSSLQQYLFFFGNDAHINLLSI
ncbi:hypothetical protein HMPREF0083_05790 [Aneurinibacillus aneurinilyticus ATCC 12856]|uniref:Uncharacterized protein n=1 Tax=Aneurinibacillus aneurinilyticus ATCC 12856 TaxID=649747 RepID=U1Y2R6_ANEAE|nr:hypothetical protein HMPREF0083_05790 [Aneurinibacillus aneurinilyticus ATCC 12856]